MVKLEAITKDCQLTGVEGDSIVKVVTLDFIGDNAVTIYYKNNEGELREQMLFREDEAKLSLAENGRPWSFNANADEFKIALEALRIQLAHLFDPMMAVHTSNVEPLPHQISAVYEAMLSKQPLRFVLADDPGAGKTIMAGLLIRELLMRADAQRILIVSPGSLTEQWQDELLEKFNVQFEIFSKEKQEQSPTGNYFGEQDLLIARLDQLSRSEVFQEKLKNTEWDLIVVDEAHKMSASYYGNSVKKTQRFQLGELLGSITRHFLLMTATPHNGKEEDFQLFLSLLDGDRFYGKFRDGAHKVDVSDIMRRMVKEELLKFDGTPLFPERRAYTANFTLSDQEAELYTTVTEYVRNEMSRADSLDGKRKGNVGFALTQLQRRLASSPEAIYQSLKRRKNKLENKLEEFKLLSRGANSLSETMGQYSVKEDTASYNMDDVEDELTAEEYEAYVDEVVDQSTASQTIDELTAEIEILVSLAKQALEVVNSRSDKKWEELSSLLFDTDEMFTETGARRKLIIFTEHKDTLNYLYDRISNLFGIDNAVVTIHGGTARDTRRKIQEEFRNNPDVLVLIATDAAGEGVNLQNANLMVNYDLPWNPNRLEQRFGRIHRIGQTEVCHLWNIVANETREGAVFQKLFEKLEIEKQALGGRVFDILGEAFENVSLKELLIEAIRYGEQPEVQAKLSEKIEGALDTEHIKNLLRRNALTEEHMTIDELYSVKEELEKAEARKLQPYFVRSFFVDAFGQLSGTLRKRESGRFEITHVPAAIRERDRVIGESRTPVLRKYERVCFEKEHTRIRNKPMADLVHPGHPLMHAVTDLTLSNHRTKLKQGTILVDPYDDTTEPKVLFMIDHSLREATGKKQRTVSRRIQFVTIAEDGTPVNAGAAPHLDYLPLDNHQQSLVEPYLNASWVSHDLEKMALGYAMKEMVPSHHKEVKNRIEHHADKILAAVNDRLVKEIQYWSDRYIKLNEDVQANKQPKMQPENARRTAEELTVRLERRQKEVEQMKSVVSNTPSVLGGAFIIPQGLISQLQGDTTFLVNATARLRIEKIAMDAVIKAEKELGHIVKDLSAKKCGWDITAHIPHNDKQLYNDRHIEVKGRSKGQETITVSKNEIICGLNQKDKFILAVVIVDGDSYEGPYYVKEPFTSEPDPGATSINYDLKTLLSKAVSPEESI